MLTAQNARTGFELIIAAESSCRLSHGIVTAPRLSTTVTHSLLRSTRSTLNSADAQGDMSPEGFQN